MTKIIKPSFALGYWKPHDEQTSYWDSYQLYIRDTSLQKYNAEIVGSYIEKASNKNIEAISEMATRLGYKIDETNNHLSEISFGVRSMVYGNRLQIEQQKATNILLNDIKKLLRLPDSERERIYAIELGLKFFTNAQNDPDLFNDALIEFQKAENIMNQDYFVLHKIGLIYLLVDQHLNVPKALEYFKKAAKYASVESNNDIRSLAYLSNDHETYSDIKLTSNNISDNEIKIMASESFDKAAFSAYILGDIEEAIELQSKAIKLNASAQNIFFLGKYQIRAGLNNDGIDSLNKAVEILPELLELTIKDLDLNSNTYVLDRINQILETLNNKIQFLQVHWKNSKSEKSAEIVKELKESFSLKFAERENLWKQLTEKMKEYNSSEKQARDNLTSVLNKIENYEFFSINTSQKSNLVSNIKNQINNGSVEEMKNLYTNTNQLIHNDDNERRNYVNKIAAKEKKEAEDHDRIMKWVVGIFIYLLIAVVISVSLEISFGYALLFGPIFLIMLLAII